MSTFNKEEWKSLLSVPTVALKDDIFERIKVHKEVIQKWIDGSIIEVKRKDGSWEERTNNNNKFVCFNTNEEYRVQPYVEFNLTLSKKKLFLLLVFWKIQHSTM